jgi:hypothetical protein
LRDAPGALAWGAVYRLPPTARATLDRIEGAGRGYRVETMDLAGHGRCWLYRAEDDAIDPTLVPFDWYHALVLAGARHHGFPADYLAAIAAVATRVDDDALRRRQHFALLAPAGDPGS